MAGCAGDRTGEGIPVGRCRGGGRPQLVQGFLAGRRLCQFPAGRGTMSLKGTRGLPVGEVGRGFQEVVGTCLGCGPPEAASATVSPTGKWPHGRRFSVCRVQLSAEAGKTAESRPPSPQDHGRSQPPWTMAAPEEGLLAPASLTVCLPCRHPRAQRSRAEGAGEQAEGAGGVPPSHLPPGGRAVCGLARHPGRMQEKGVINVSMRPASETGLERRRAAGPCPPGARARGLPAGSCSARAWRRPCSLRPLLCLLPS